MIKFCENYNILASTAFRFKSKRSSIDETNAVTEYIRSETKAKRIGQACFIDLQKAFDTFDHDIFTAKLDKYVFDKLDKYDRLVSLYRAYGKRGKV